MHVSDLLASLLPSLLLASLLVGGRCGVASFQARWPAYIRVCVSVKAGVIIPHATCLAWFASHLARPEGYDSRSSVRQFPFPSISACYARDGRIDSYGISAATPNSLERVRTRRCPSQLAGGGNLQIVGSSTLNNYIARSVLAGNFRA